MSDQAPPFGAGSNAGAGDPLGSMVAAMCDAWVLALSALRAAAAGGAGSPMRGGDPASEAVAAMTGFAAAMSDLASQASASRFQAPGAAATAAQAADLMPIMARACTVAARSTLDYWRSLAEVYARHQASLLHSLAPGEAAASDAARRQIADELCGYFREVGEVAMREARRLEAELAQISEAVATAAEQPDATAPHRRHWQAKG